MDTSDPKHPNTLEHARRLDSEDELAGFRERFLIPRLADGREAIYLVGNSLGLQPRATRAYIEQELEDWARLGVEGHLYARDPWLPYHELLTEQTARLVGALPTEVVLMNTLTVNLHLMMVSFYRPSPERPAILMEAGAFPSDRYAVASQIRFHGFDPHTAMIELRPRAGEPTLRLDDMLETIASEGPRIALVLLGNVNYLTGQAFDMRAIVAAARAQGCMVGFDLAHGAGNLVLTLHDDGPDFAVWCSYKYLNGGPGTIAGCFVHERHARSPDLPRFAGWWGHDKRSRFRMDPIFRPIEGAEGWQLSNPPIFQLAALRASLAIFDEANMARLRAKSEALTGLLERLVLAEAGAAIDILTPSDPAQRGAQLSLRIRGDARGLLQRLQSHGVFADFREPDVIRVAPVPLYTRFEDVWQFADLIRRELRGSS